jgi:hypothetical protein
VSGTARRIGRHPQTTALDALRDPPIRAEHLIATASVEE